MARNSIGMIGLCTRGACMALAFLALSCAKDEPKLIPTDVLFGYPTKSMPGISPDARRLSYVAPYNGVPNIWVRTIGQTDDRAITRDTDRGITKYFWAYDNKRILYFQDAQGTDNWRLYGIDAASGDVTDYTPFDSVKVGVVLYSKKIPREIIIQMNKENRSLSDAYHLDLETGALEMAAKNPGSVLRWIPDNDLVVRGALASGPEEEPIFSCGRTSVLPGRPCAPGIPTIACRAAPFGSRATERAYIASTRVDSTRADWSKSISPTVR